jgi:putative transposase
MPWKECHVVDERLRFVARLLEGESMTAVCAEFGISRTTDYKIYDRYKDYVPGLGAPKIREKLRGRCGPLRCPAISTVHAVLDRHGLVQRRGVGGDGRPARRCR